MKPNDNWDWNSSVPRRRMMAAKMLQLHVMMSLEDYGWPKVLDFWMAQGFTPSSRRLVIGFLVPAYCEELAADGHEMTNQEWGALATELTREATIRMDCEQ